MLKNTPDFRGSYQLFMKNCSSPIVDNAKVFYGTTLYSWAAYPSIFHHLEAIANKMWEEVRDKLECVFIEINNNNRAYLGMLIEALKERPLALQDCQTTIANELGFGN